MFRIPWARSFHLWRPTTPAPQDMSPAAQLDEMLCECLCARTFRRRRQVTILSTKTFRKPAAQDLVPPARGMLCECLCTRSFRRRRQVAILSLKPFRKSMAEWAITQSNPQYSANQQRLACCWLPHTTGHHNQYPRLFQSLTLPFQYRLPEFQSEKPWSVDEYQTVSR